MAVDPAGNVYVADTGNDRLQKFTKTGTVVATWGADLRLSASPGQAPGFGDPIVLSPSRTATSTIKIESINNFSGPVSLTAGCCQDFNNSGATPTG